LKIPHSLPCHCLPPPRTGGFWGRSARATTTLPGRRTRAGRPRPAPGTSVAVPKWSRNQTRITIAVTDRKGQPAQTTLSCVVVFLTMQKRTSRSSIPCHRMTCQHLVSPDEVHSSCNCPATGWHSRHPTSSLCWDRGVVNYEADCSIGMSPNWSLPNLALQPHSFCLAPGGGAVL